MYSLHIVGEYLSYVPLVHDVVLFSKSFEYLQRMIFGEASKRASPNIIRLVINISENIILVLPAEYVSSALKEILDLKKVFNLKIFE